MVKNRCTLHPISCTYNRSGEAINSCRAGIPSGHYRCPTLIFPLAEPLSVSHIFGGQTFVILLLVVVVVMVMVTVVLGDKLIQGYEQ